LSRSAATRRPSVAVVVDATDHHRDFGGAMRTGRARSSAIRPNTRSNDPQTMNHPVRSCPVFGRVAGRVVKGMVDPDAMLVVGPPAATEVVVAPATVVVVVGLMVVVVAAAAVVVGATVVGATVVGATVVVVTGGVDTAKLKPVAVDPDTVMRVCQYRSV
jgi:hypothetical protein